MEYIVNTAIKIPFKSTNLATGLTSFTTRFLNNGTTVSVTPTFSEIGGGLYTANFTPSVTGKWTLFVDGNIYDFEIVSKTLQNVLGDVFDATVGSWVWNKVTGVLTLYKADSSVLATYQVEDSPDEASREKLS